MMKIISVIQVYFSYKVSVIGCSGPVGSNQNQLGQIDSDLVGIGKSSFCARFMYPDQVLFLPLRVKDKLFVRLNFAKNG